MKNIKPLFSITVAILCLMLFTQCGSERQTERTGKAENATNVERHLTGNHGKSIRIAYINLDTIMYRYEFALDINKEMISKEAKMVATLETKRKVIEEEIAQFEYKCNARLFTNEEAYINEREEIMRKEKEFMSLRDEMYAEWESENFERGKKLRERINRYIQEYNDKNGYDFILTKIGDNILYANDTYDITNDILDGLNNRYRKTKQTKNP